MKKKLKKLKLEDLKVKSFVTEVDPEKTIGGAYTLSITCNCTYQFTCACSNTCETNCGGCSQGEYTCGVECIC